MVEGIVPAMFLPRTAILVILLPLEHVTPVQEHTPGDGTPPGQVQPVVKLVFAVKALAKSHIAVSWEA